MTVKSSNSKVTSTALQCLSFSMASGQRAMLPTSDLVEALTIGATQVIPIPDTPASVMGVCNWRGEVLWLVDLGNLLGDAPIYSGVSQPSSLSVIVMRTHDTSLGLVVDHVTAMLWCDRAQITDSNPQSPAHTFLQGLWKMPQTSDVFLVLDSTAIQEHFD
jgi:positive phototaxis protein PixI